MIEEIEVEAYQPSLVRLRNIFSSTYVDRGVGVVKWRRLGFVFSSTDFRQGDGRKFIQLDLHQNAVQELSYSMGKALAPSNFEANGVKGEFCWRSDSESSPAVDGIYGLSVRLDDNWKGRR